MIRGYEIAIGIMMILALLFPFRPVLLKNFRTLVGAIVGLVVGRIAYVYISKYFGFQSEIVKFIVMLIMASLFSDASSEFLDKLFPKKTDKRDG